MDSTLDQLLDDVPTPPLMPGYFYLACFNPQPGSKTSDSDLYATTQDEIGLSVKAEAFNGQQTQNFCLTELIFKGLFANIF